MSRNLHRGRSRAGEGEGRVLRAGALGEITAGCPRNFRKASAWLQPCEGWGGVGGWRGAGARSRGLCQPRENVGFHLTDDGQASSVLGLGLTGSCSRLEVSPLVGWGMALRGQRVGTETNLQSGLAYYRAFLPGFDNECRAYMLELAF